jgi:hypothetical protein
MKKFKFKAKVKFNEDFYNSKEIDEQLIRAIKEDEGAWVEGCLIGLDHNKGTFIVQDVIDIEPITETIYGFGVFPVDEDTVQLVGEDV